MTGLFIGPVVSQAQNIPPLGDTGGQTDGSGPDQVLKNIQLGSLTGYSRLVFTFENPIGQYSVERIDADTLSLDFGSSKSVHMGPVKIGDAMVEGVLVAGDDKHLTVVVRTRPSRFNFRHFTSPDALSVVVDLRPVQAGSLLPGNRPVELKLDSIQELAKAERARLALRPQPGTAEDMLAQGVSLLADGRLAEGVKALEDFKAKYPASTWRDPALFLLGDAYYHLDPEKLNDNFLPATETLKTALGLFPKSRLAARARLILALCYLKMDFITEAAEYLKRVIKEFPDSIEASLAQVYLGELFLKLEKPQLAKTAFDAALAINPTGSFFLDAYFKLGQVYFTEGLFSESTEVFKGILKRDGWYYLKRPEILYYMGEGYFHLKRYGLSREFLFHSINMEPEQPDADILMARLGDAYKEEGLNEDAVKLYKFTVDLYPDTAGALISKIRLADYGALGEIFDPDNVFREMENGAQATAIKIYSDIVESGQDMPLIQLAMFKLGQAYLKNDDYPKAVAAFKKLLETYPKSTLAGEARRFSDEAVFEEVKRLYDSNKFSEIISFYTDNKSMVDKKNWPEIRHYLALAYDRLDNPRESAELLEANKDLTDKEEERIYTLGRNYLKLGRYEDAYKVLDQFRKKFPESPRVAESLMEQARVELAQGLDDEALKHLEEAISMDPGLGENVKTQEALGRIYIKKGNLYKAVTAIKKSLDYLKAGSAGKEELFQAYSSLGQALAGLGRKDEAEVSLKAAMENLPAKPSPESLYLIANSYRSLGLEKDYRKILELVAQSSDQFWRSVAEEELKALVPEDGQISKLLN
jgi:TolA-binding protein